MMQLLIRARVNDEVLRVIGEEVAVARNVAHLDRLGEGDSAAGGSAEPVAEARREGAVAWSSQRNQMLVASEAGRTKEGISTDQTDSRNHEKQDHNPQHCH